MNDGTKIQERQSRVKNNLSLLFSFVRLKSWSCRVSSSTERSFSFSLFRPLLLLLLLQSASNRGEEERGEEKKKRAEDEERPATSKKKKKNLRPNRPPTQKHRTNARPAFRRRDECTVGRTDGGSVHGKHTSLATGQHQIAADERTILFSPLHFSYVGSERVRERA